VVIGEGSRISDGVTIMAGCVLGRQVTVGEGTVIYPRVAVYDRTEIGRRVILHSGAVVGSDGFGYAVSAGEHVKIPHIGRVVIEDDVEIGANTTIDRATLGETRIGAGTKIDNLVQVAHNVTVGRGVVIVAQCGIAGSVIIGDGAVLAGQIGVKDHVHIGARAPIVAKSAVTTVEHLLAAPAGVGVSNLRVEVRGEELPILDGSAAPYVEALTSAGIIEQAGRRPVRTVHSPLWVSQDAAWILAVPADRLRVTYIVSLRAGGLGTQVVDFDPSRHQFVDEIAPSRTWGFADELQTLQRAGLARGASASNALGIGAEGYLSPPR